MRIINYTIWYDRFGFYIRYHKGIFFHWSVNLFGLIIVKEI